MTTEQIIFICLIAIITGLPIFFLGKMFGKGPVKKVPNGFYTAWGGHRKHDDTRGKDFFYLLLRRLNQDSKPIYLETKNYKVCRDKFSGERVVVDNDIAEIRMVTSPDIFDRAFKKGI